MAKIDTDSILNALCEGGSVASRLEYYEPRQSQLDLMEMIIRCFNEDAIGAAEAGTGVGKSFAYLLPSMHFAVQARERVIISTATITLQQQLFSKDIPLVRDALGLKIKSVLVKGRGNYLCRRKLEEAIREPELTGSEEQEQIEKIVRWSQICKNGSKDELDFVPADSVWSRVCSDSEACMGKYCPGQSRCCITALRKEAASSNIIVVNHHLLFADLAARMDGAGYEATVVLPPYSRVIIDEAHTIEGAATSFFSSEFGKVSIFMYLGRLFRKRRNKRSGLLLRLFSLLPASASMEDEIENIIKKIDNLRHAASELDKPALELCGDEGVFRFSPQKDNSGAEGSVFPLLVSFSKKLSSFTELAREYIDLYPDKDNEEPVIWELKAILRGLDNIARVCIEFTAYRKSPDDVMWIEQRGRGKDSWAVFSKSPVELAGKLKESLFAPNKTVVCVSATLAINSRFDFWAARSGVSLLNDRQFNNGCFPSPFPYSDAVLLAAPDDAPLPDEQGYQDFVDRSVAQLAASSGGSALILFTSYQSLNSAWNAAYGALEGLGIRCLKQGDDDRSRLLRNFLDDESSVLFATDSFWEGVDAPGDTLRLVILCRLPFKSPNDPVFEARRESVAKNGGNPFMELSLPDAVMKFKQGFGRLMRRSSDRGVVAVLDGRLLKKQYGSFFIQSLPETRTSFTGSANILRDVENFLY